MIKLSANNKIIVDTNIPCNVLKEISDYNHVAIMLSAPSISTDKFFDRDDKDKQFLLSEIAKCPNPEKILQNFKDCIARINSQKYYNLFKNSGFFTIVRRDIETDTRAETLEIIAKHFDLLK